MSVIGINELYMLAVYGNYTECTTLCANDYDCLMICHDEYVQDVNSYVSAFEYVGWEINHQLENMTSSINEYV